MSKKTKKNIKVRDLNPKKDAKGGGTRPTSTSPTGIGGSGTTGIGGSGTTGIGGSGTTGIGGSGTN